MYKDADYSDSPLTGLRLKYRRTNTPTGQESVFSFLILIP